MKENIVLSDYPQAKGVYWFVNNNEIIYVGSSCDLHRRMIKHRADIKSGSTHGSKQDFYQFLQSNQFEVQYQLTDNYRQLEQELIEKYQPKYNSLRAFTGCGARKGREAEYKKEWQQKYQKQYQKQLCNYNGEILTLNALQIRFGRQGVEHPQLEAKKYLIK